MTSSSPHALVVAYDFPPHAAIGTMRTLRVVQQMVREGWQVTVLTSDPRTYRPGTPVDDALLSRVPAGVRVARAPSVRGFELVKGAAGRFLKREAGPGAASAGAGAGTPQPSVRTRSLPGRTLDWIDATLAIPDNESAWLVPAIARGLALAAGTRFDLLYSSAPPWTGQLVASALAAACRCAWVADFRDPWARAPWREARLPVATRAAIALERFVVRSADHVVFVAQANRDDFAAYYGPGIAPKLHVVPNGCDLSEFDGLQRDGDGARNCFTLLHAGSLYGGRTPASLMRALSTAVRRGLVQREGFRLEFLGTNGLGPELQALCRELDIEDMVHFQPRVPRRESIRAMAGASALLLLQPGHTVSVPGKLYEYLALGRPILAIAEEGETATLVRQSGLGVSVTAEPEEAVLDALLSVIRRAALPTEPPPRHLFDGMARAADIVALLGAIVRGEVVSAPVRQVQVQP